MCHDTTSFLGCKFRRRQEDLAFYTWKTPLVVYYAAATTLSFTRVKDSVRELLGYELLDIYSSSKNVQMMSFKCLLTCK